MRQLFQKLKVIQRDAVFVKVNILNEPVIVFSDGMELFWEQFPVGSKTDLWFKEAEKYIDSHYVIPGLYL